ncbi:MAG: TVP38/TMEM64 family protein [Nitriliruptoraceae bacterium]|nr:TVP38/TMEM64 family protein [Nitriliruptoraceae bacterium]
MDDTPDHLEAPSAAATSVDGEPRGRARWLTSPWLRVGVLVALVAFALAISLGSDELSLGAIRSQVDELGALGPLAWIAIYLVATVLLLPGTPFTIGAGVLFGPVVGALTALVGATLGATASFLVGRGIGRGAVASLAGRRIQAMDRFLSERGFASVLLVRLVPLFPFNLVNLVAGVTALRLTPYVLGTAIGIVPGTVLLAVSGGSIEDPTSPLFLGSVAGFVLLVVVGGVAARRLRPTDDPASDTIEHP